MKNKILPFVILLLLLGPLSFGQRIYFSDSSNYWMTKYTVGAGSSDPYYEFYPSYRYDTTVIEWNGHSYRSLRGLLIRDDTNAHVVYAKATSFSSINRFRVLDTVNEFVYMDYNLSVGDTLHLPLIYYEDSINISTVTSVDSISINSEWYKRMEIEINRLFESVSSQYYWTAESYIVIEGVGYEHGPLIDIRGDGEWRAPFLICFKSQDTIPYNLYNNCNPNAISINEMDNNSTDFQLFPNPASNSFMVNYKGEYVSVFQITVTDLLGKTKLEKTFKQDAAVDAASLPAGIYFVRISDSGILLQTKKLVISK